MEFKLPDLGEGVHEGQILAVHVKEGQSINEDEILLEVETDKAAVEIPSPCTGIVTTVHIKDKQLVHVGDVMVTFNTNVDIESASKDPKKSGAVIGIRTSNYKYFRSRYDPKKNVNLYDLQKDPKEEHNILNAELIKKMEEKLSYFIEKSKSVKENKINEDEEAQLEKELQKMGYID